MAKNMNNNIVSVDMFNQASVLLINLKEIINKLQLEKNYFKTQVVKLQVEKKQLLISNKNLTNKVNMLEKGLQSKVSL